MRASLAFCAVSACSVIAAACSSSGGLASTFSAYTGGGGAGLVEGAGAAGVGGIGGAIASSSVSSTSSSSQASSSSSSSASSSSSSSSSGTGGGAACSYAYPNTCDVPEQLTQVNGDSGSDTDTVTGTTSQWFSVLVVDSFDPFSSAPESFTATLTSPPGMRFDLYAYEGTIGSMPVQDCDATALHGMGTPETITDQWPDNDTTTDDRVVLFEVRYVSGTACGSAAQWTLTVAGDTQ